MSSPSIGLTFIVHLKIISKLKEESVSKVNVASANGMRTPSWLLSISGVIRILMRINRLTNGKPCMCYNVRLYDFYDMGYFTE